MTPQLIRITKVDAKEGMLLTVGFESQDGDDWFPQSKTLTEYPQQIEQYLEVLCHISGRVFGVEFIEPNVLQLELGYYKPTKKNPNSSPAEVQAQTGNKLINGKILPLDGLKEVEPLIEKSGGRMGRMCFDRDFMFVGRCLFRMVALPDGWRLIHGENCSYSLLDERGENVASIFWKSAFYDRRASIRLEKI